MADHPPPMPPDNAPTAPDANEIQALLDQAEALALDAATQVGADPSTRSDKSLDIERPPIGTTLLDDQMDEVAALAAQAGRETGVLEPTVVIPITASASTHPQDASGDSSSHVSSGCTNADDMLNEIIEQAENASPSAVAVEEAVRQSAATQVAGQDALNKAPAQAEVEPLAPLVSALSSDSQTESPDSTTPVHRMSLLAMPLVLLNRPFARVGDEMRTLAGWIALVTLLTAAVMWLLPYLLKPTVH